MSSSPNVNLMEPHRNLEIGPDYDKPVLSDDPREYFKKALRFVREHYSEEFERISSVRFSEVTPDFFFREYVWVVHATGFSAKAVGRFMERLMPAYGAWDSLADETFDVVMSRVRSVCNNSAKAKAIWTTAGLMKDGIESRGWDEWRQSKLSSPELLSKLPYVGKVTCFHLGRNVGLLDCVKPDLHLVRMAEHWGYSDCRSMCEDMGSGHDLPLGMVDLVIWYAASTFGTSEIKRDGSR